MSESRGRGNGDSSWRTRRNRGVGSDGGSAAFSECGTRSSGSGERLGEGAREAHYFPLWRLTPAAAALPRPAGSCRTRRLGLV